MPRVAVDKQTGTRVTRKNPWIIGACLGSHWGNAGGSDIGQGAHFGSHSVNPASFLGLENCLPCFSVGTLVSACTRSVYRSWNWMTGPLIQAEFRLALDERLKVLSVSAGIDALLGISAEDFLASRVSLKDRIHADDADIAGMLFSQQQRTIPVHSTSASVMLTGRYAASGGSTPGNRLKSEGKPHSICCCKKRRVSMGI